MSEISLPKENNWQNKKGRLKKVIITENIKYLFGED